MLYTLKQAGDIVGLSANSLRRYIYDGKLKGIKQGRDWFVSQSVVNRLKNRKRYTTKGQIL